MVTVDGLFMKEEAATRLRRLTEGCPYLAGASEDVRRLARCFVDPDEAPPPKPDTTGYTLVAANASTFWPETFDPTSERAGDAETLDAHDAEALGAAPVVSFDDDGDWDDLAKPKDLDAKAVKELVSKGRDTKPKAVAQKTRKTSKVASEEDAVELAAKSSKSSKPSSKPKAVAQKTRKTSKVASEEDAVELAAKSSKSSKPSSKP